jgi:hypothetical protein
VDIGLWGMILSGFNNLDGIKEAKSWKQPQIEAKYIMKYHGDGLIWDTYSKSYLCCFQNTPTFY